MLSGFKKIMAGLGAIALSLSLTACNTTSKSPDTKHDKTLEVFATTGYIADAVKNIAPKAKVYTMVKPGGDPHTYQPSTKDVEQMNKADAILWNGLHLEAHMLKQLASYGDKQIALGEAISKDFLLPWPEKDDQGNQLHDPHIWNNTKAWQEIVIKIGEFLGKRDPQNAETYKKNAASYSDKIKAAHEQAVKVLGALPANERYLITGHDAFQYLGHTYNLKVEATDFVTSEAEKSAADLKALAEQIAKNKVKTIFVDNLQNPQAVKALQESVKSMGWDVKISPDELYADSLGDHAPVDTYLGVLKHNTEAIAKGLAGK